MNTDDDFAEIIEYAHFWNWVPDWEVVKEVYQAFPASYSILMPFAYAYLEEVIRSTTSEYGRELLNESGGVKKRKVGLALLTLAIDENKDKNSELTRLIENIKSYYYFSQRIDKGDNRHSVAHGYMHSRFWDKTAFENLIHDIAKLSQYAMF